MPMQLLRNTALRQSSGGSVSCFTASNGNILTVVADNNLSTVTTGGDQSNNLKIYIYETVVSTRVTTLKHTITSFPVSASQAGTPLLDASRIMVAQFPNGNDLAIGVGRTDRTAFYYTKFNYAAVTTSAFETVNMPVASTDQFQKISMVVSDTGSVYWAAWVYNASSDQLKLHLALRRAADNTWQIIQNFVGGTYAPLTSVATYWHECTNIQILALNVVANVANCVVFFSAGGANSSGARVYREPRIMTLKVNETTGAVSSITSRGAYGSMAPNGNQRQAMALFRSGRHGYVWYLQGMTYPLKTTATEQKTYHAKSATYDGTTYLQRDTDVTIWTEGVNQAFSLTDNINFSAPTFSCDTADVPYNECAFMWVYPRIISSSPSGAIQASAFSCYGGSLFGTHLLRPASLLDSGGLSSGKIKRNAYPGFNNWRPSGMAKSKMPYVCKTDDGKLWLDWVEPESLWNVTTKVHGAIGSSIVSFTPSEDSNYQTGAPPTSVIFDDNKPNCPTPWRMEFQASQDSGFASGIKTSLWPVSSMKFPNGTDSSSGTTVAQNWTTDIAQKLVSGVWYVRCRMVDYVENVGPWSLTQQFTVGHPPTAIPKSPINSISIPEVGSNLYNFSWEFSDTFAGDTQSAYQVKIYRASDDTVVLDTGKVTSTVNNVDLTIDTSTTTFYELYWSVTLWDADNVSGLPSEFKYFNIIQPPTVALTVPADEAVVATNIPTLTFTPTSPNSYTFTKYTVTLTKNGLPLYSTEVEGNWASGASIDHLIPPGYITIGSGYQAYVTATDSAGFTATSTLNDFSVAWTAPALTTLTVDVAPYETDGYVNLTWNDSEQHADWMGYNVYRSYDAGVTYELIYQEDADSTLFSFTDFFALSGTQVWYTVVQVVNTSGFVREGAYNWVTATPVADGYWLIRPGNDLSAYRIFRVTSDSYTDEQEEEEASVIGRGRVVNKGDRLGLKGSLTAQLRDNPTYTARQMKQQLEELQHENIALMLRTPFGDIYSVSLSSMSVSRVAGVGHAEFCDVTIPYSEVS